MVDGKRASFWAISLYLRSSPIFILIWKIFSLSKPWLVLSFQNKEVIWTMKDLQNWNRILFVERLEHLSQWIMFCMCWINTSRVVQGQCWVPFSTPKCANIVANIPRCHQTPGVYFSKHHFKMLFLNSFSVRAELFVSLWLFGMLQLLLWCTLREESK